jgi:hypothetical protein
MVQHPSALMRSARLGAICLLIGCTSRTVLHGFADEPRDLGGACVAQGDCQEGLVCDDGGTCQIPANVIFRSVGPGSTAPLASGTADNAMILEGNVATFSNPLPGRVGVGDAVVYSADGGPIVDRVAFIARRVSPTVLALQAADGADPAAISEPDTARWSILRAYAGLHDALVGSENPGLPVGLGDFDSAGQDLVATDQVWNIACFADAVDTNSTFLALGGAPWSTSPSSYLRIFTPVAAWEVGASQRHTGVFDSTRYSIVSTAAGNPALAIYGNAVRVEGLQVDYNVASGGQGAIFVQTDDADIRISHTIVRGRANNPGANGILIQGATAYTTRLWNNLVHGFDGSCIVDNTLADTAMQVTIYNNTLSCGSGLRVERATVVAKNNIFANVRDACVDEQGGDTFGSDYNVCNLDETLVGASSVSAVSAAFVDAATGDFHLSPADTVAADRGADLSADLSLAFTTDLDGDSREGSWDIGADER